ncbi:MAG: hypothetical protein UY92_C0020G0010 [Candidatus Magasanikbacteria bacterium GW2011_GWA2_56_11]|uniref:Uncharacterized protein n=1 Tax=Candidatus Magasanikbacteria bacterium GW2011_GWA2_56_11 TaxID=1619044 RepID=A0A0G2AJL1_9BACT|nr:MAG: hypothetical protein UY92_C0020G0010 [Candidatus Magasanikbacteria bacterium GW2011_GWA2_56_11]
MPGETGRPDVIDPGEEHCREIRWTHLPDEIARLRAAGDPRAEELARQYEIMEAAREQTRPAERGDYPGVQAGIEAEAARVAADEDRVRKLDREAALQEALGSGLLEDAANYIEQWGVADRDYASVAELKEALESTCLFHRDASEFAPARHAVYVSARINGQPRTVRLDMTLYTGRNSSALKLDRATVWLGKKPVGAAD